jgi:hypothetical protein
MRLRIAGCKNAGSGTAKAPSVAAMEGRDVYQFLWFSLMVPRNSGRDLAPVARIVSEPVAVASSGPFPRPLFMRLSRKDLSLEAAEV